MIQEKRLPAYFEIIKGFFRNGRINFNDGCITAYLTEREFVCKTKNSIPNSIVAYELFEVYNNLNEPQLGLEGFDYLVDTSLLACLINKGSYVEVIGKAAYDGFNWLLDYKLVKRNAKGLKHKLFNTSVESRPYLWKVSQLLSKQLR
ncbi:hypothetical protein GF352_03280 [archaeon]|nr:hypothetical protein [archaeon]